MTRGPHGPVVVRPGTAAATIDGVCTVVVRWSPGEPSRILAIRDELTSREFDEPGRWWAAHPGIVGGRDRVAGGTWCATRVDTGVTALVLNRPQKPVADPGAPSRGTLPLLAAERGTRWLPEVRLDGMAGFLLVLAAPDRLTTWDFDGTDLVRTEHAEGTWMVTSGGPEDRKVDRFLPLFAGADHPDGWRRLVQDELPRDDPGALLVRHEQDGLVFATVFAGLIDARPGRLRLQYSRRPWLGPWHSLAVG